MKRSVPLSQIRDTPVGARRDGDPEPPSLWPSPFRAPSPEQRRRKRPARIARRPDCMWPKCPKPIAWPESKLCVAHMAIIVRDYVRIMGPLDAIAREVGWDIPIRDVAPKVKVDKPGIVYFLQVGGHIKIGWTSDLTKRMRQYPPNAQLLATHPGLRKDELRLHKMFAAHRSHGREWYPLAPVILDHIKRVIAEHGQPVDVIFGAKPTEVPQPRPHQYIGGDRIGSGSTPRTVRG